MPLTTLLAAVLTSVGTAAAVHTYRRSKGTALVSAGLGLIMLAALLVPGFTGPAASAASLALLLPLCAAYALSRRHELAAPGTAPNRIRFGLALADIEFMAIAMFLMSAHRATLSAAGAASTAGMAHTASMPGMAPTAPGSEAMLALIILGWATCAAALVIPLGKHDKRHGAWHGICSGAMIAATALMAF